ncbi:GNAT family N-acetyltransferase [Actinoplanes sp. URMC 104]|uniref:GNAT family N-acetyltransferase n=1 Tax=Actinoplanes sp. URMC 104 TaxID=3423409 RepID=UPI003F1DF8AF
MPSLDDVAAATGADPLMMWAADRPGVRVWTRPGATAVACPDLSRHDRLAIHGDPDAVARLLEHVLPEAGPTFRPVGAEDLVLAVAERLPTVEVRARFGWMDTTRVPPVAGAGGWLDDSALPEVRALLDEAAPDSYAVPGGTGVRRWAGLRDAGGALVAVAADAWSSPGVGFVAGVATRPDQRGRGRAATLCAFVTSELLAGRPRVALLVDYWNVAAVAVYRRLGFALRPVAAAHQVTG